jgi:hypothetical protein
MAMRIAALILAVLGGLFSALLAVKWLGDVNEYQRTIAAAAELGVDMSELNALVRGSYALLGSCVLGIVGGVLALKGKGKPAGALLLIAVVAPAIFTAKTLLTTSFILIAAILAFLSKPKAAPAPAPAS